MFKKRIDLKWRKELQILKQHSNNNKAASNGNNNSNNINEESINYVNYFVDIDLGYVDWSK